MGKRLIIQHGERTTRHELSGKSITIGRDPSCDLFFADQKLSRRHARVESDADGVRLIDLGSRNGSWVNEQRVDERVLQIDDRVRLGRLQITLEEDLTLTSRSPTGEEATVVLSGTDSAADEGRTMRIDAQSSAARTAEAPVPEDTVLFGVTPTPDRDRTVVLPGTPTPSEDGTVIFQPPSEGSTDTTTPALQAPVPTERALGREEGVVSGAHELPPTAVGVAAEPSAEEPSGQAVHRVSLKPVLVMVLLSFVAYLLVAVPLVLRTRSMLREESFARGRALVDLLAAHNGAALAAGDLGGVSVDWVGSQPGVDEAWILDAEGLVLASSGGLGRSQDAIETASLGALESDDLYSRRIGLGEYVLVRAITLRDERVGYAVLLFSGPRIAETKSVPVLLCLGFLLIAGGAWGGYYLSHKQSLERVATETTLAEKPDPTLIE